VVVGVEHHQQPWQPVRRRRRISREAKGEESVYDFLDDDLPSEYYKELLYRMFQKQKQSKKHMDYEQVINVLAREKLMYEEELRATKSKAMYQSYLPLDIA
nr:regulator of chromosome condensation (RCC1) family protein [Tanacetum cinerariifolium]